MSDTSLFKGVALVIDDELGDPTSAIEKIRDDLHASGNRTIGLRDLPAKDADLAHYAAVSFVVLDWNLLGTQLGTTEQPGVLPPAGLVAQKRKDIFDFITKFRETRFVPVFIFTQEEPEAVEAALETEPALFQRSKPSHIFVKRKSEVMEGVVGVLDSWIQGVPSALVLKLWEREYERAKNSLFIDFYLKSIYWPALLWEAFNDDGLPAADELGLLISRNLMSRMTPFHLDMRQFLNQLQELKDHNPDTYRSDLLSVLEGERFIHAKGLNGDATATGDVFKKGKKYLINIRPDCDCVARDGADVLLYLLEGKKLGPAEEKRALADGRSNPIERDDNAIVFAMHEGRSVCFKFKDLEITPWLELRADRIGRLVPPFSTRIQQRYAAYLQRAGLPPIPKFLRNIEATASDIAQPTTDAPTVAIPTDLATAPSEVEISTTGGETAEEASDSLVDRVVGTQPPPSIDISPTTAAVESTPADQGAPETKKD